MVDIQDNRTQLKGSVITEELLHAAIRKKEGRDDVLITKIHTSSGTDNVKNFCSAGYFVEVVAEAGNAQSVHTLFVKTAAEDEATKQWSLKDTPIFFAEEKMYAEVFPDMRKSQITKCGYVFGPSVPDYYHSIVTGDKGVIVLQNCQPGGFGVVATKQGADYEHCKLIMKETAVFHALSWAMKNENFVILEKYPHLSSYRFIDDSLDPFLDQGVKSFIELVKERMPDEHIKKEVTKWSSMDLRQTLKSLCKPREPYAVVCHGDLHVFNTLFKYDSNAANRRPVDLKIIDFQYAHYSLPTVDLALFFYSSTTRETRQQHLTDLLQVYHTEFITCLDRLHVTFPEFTFPVFLDMFHQSALFGVLMSCMYVPAFLCETLDSSDFARNTWEELLIAVRDFMKRFPEICDTFPVIQERLFDNLIDLAEMGVL